MYPRRYCLVGYAAASYEAQGCSCLVIRGSLVPFREYDSAASLIRCKFGRQPAAQSTKVLHGPVVSQSTYCKARLSCSKYQSIYVGTAHECRQPSAPIKSRYPPSCMLAVATGILPTGSAWLKAARVLEVNTGASSGGGALMLEFNTPGL